MKTPPNHLERNNTNHEQPQLYEEQVRLLYKNAPVGFVATLINSAILAFILRSFIPHRILITWFIVIVLITIARYAQFVMFRRASPELSGVRRWGQWFIIGMAVIGMAWGSAGIFLFPAMSIIHQAFLAFVLGGMAIGAAGAYSVVMPAFIAYTALSLIPLIVRFLTFNDEMHLAMGGMSLLFMLLITGIALHLKRMTVASLLLRFENSNLISYLSSAKENLEKTNRELLSGIEERSKAEEELGRYRERLEELVRVRTTELSAANASLQQEIIERNKAEEAIRESEKRFRLLAEVAFDGITITEDGVILETNEELAKIFGYTPSEMKGLHVSKLIAPDYLEDAMIKIASKYDRPYESVCQKKDGQQFPIEVYGRSFSYKDRTLRITAIRDITRKIQLEEELRRTHKLESVGILAGGIAHDFNNLLTAIMNNIYLAMKHIDCNSRAYERLEAANKAILKAADLIQQLLTFAKGGAPIRKTTSIAGIIRETADFVLRGSNVKCIYMIDDNLWHVDIDEGQISQVIQNLIINAQQSMPEGGIIQIRAEKTVLISGTAMPAHNARYVKVSIQDQGIGISKEHLQKIFDPYFTTKEMGRGLGLAVVYSIIKNHGGHISAESELKKGSTFTIHLPVSEKQLEEKVLAENEQITGEGRILIMDDEEMVRNSVGEILKIIGYEVEYARDGSEAIELYRNAKESAHPFDAVILDLTVPGGVGGVEAARKLREIDPRVKAIVSSGYSNDPVMANFRDYGFDAVITKPIKVADLSNVLSKITRKDTDNNQS